jgi:very-long-chain (3R)-3-hydroxyacyl-CoA dehydratase
MGLAVLAASKFRTGFALDINKFYTCVQSVMVLDILHVLLKLVPGNIVITVIQVASRLYVAWVLLPSQAAPLPWNYIMFTAWSLAEIIRYLYYNAQSHKTFTFLRYSAFIVLYPLGVLTGELPLIYEHFVNTKALGQKRAWIDLLIFVTYIPGFPYLYLHMLKLRKKKLVGSHKIQ